MGTQMHTASAEASTLMKVNVTFSGEQEAAYKAAISEVNLEKCSEVRSLFEGMDSESPEEIRKAVDLMAWLRIEKGVRAQLIPVWVRQAVGVPGLGAMHRAREARRMHQPFTSSQVNVSPQRMDAPAGGLNPFATS